MGIAESARRGVMSAGLAVSVFALLSCGRPDPDATTGASVGAAGGMVDFQSAGMNLHVEDLAETGNVVWALDFIDAQTMIFTERQGQTRTMRLDTFEIRDIDGGPDVFAIDSGGLFDIFVDPEFAANRRLYWTYVRKIGEHSATAVARGTLRDDRIVGLEELFVANNASADHAHWGSRIVMDADRKLYVSVGERHVPDNAQNLDSHGGKILRLHDDGSVPEDNPFVGRDDAAPEIWSYGHRNPQGLAIHPETGRLFAQEHGPTGGDEINLVEKGKNYGWPVVTYGTNIWGGQKAAGTSMPGMEQPIVYFDPSIAPSGLSFYFGEPFEAWRGNLFNSTLRGPLHRVALDGTTVVEQERLLADWVDRVRDVAEGPDGFMYLATETGRIARIVPVQ